MDLDVAEDSARTVRVLAFNTLRDGTDVPGGFEMIVDTIVQSEADVVAMCEVHMRVPDFVGRLRRALKAQGHIFYGSHVGADLALISRWPVKKAEMVSSHAIGVYELESPDPMLVGVAHLNWKDYALYLPRGRDANFPYKKLNKSVVDGPTLEAVSEASGRGKAQQEFLDYIAGRDMPVILAGDFNEGSHLDWTIDTAHLFDHNGAVVDWKHSRQLCTAGFRDSWRDVYPDPVSHPGHTYPSEAWTWTHELPQVVAREGFDSYRGWAHDFASMYSSVTSPCDLSAYIEGLPPGSGYYTDPVNAGGWCRTIDASMVEQVRASYPDAWSNPNHATGNTYLPAIEGSNSSNAYPKHSSERVQYKKPNTDVDERDRIDFIYYNGRGLAPSNAWLVGSANYMIRGQVIKATTSDSIYPVTQEQPWPSDHKAVLVEFLLTGAGQANMEAWVNRQQPSGLHRPAAGSAPQRLRKIASKDLAKTLP